MLFYIVKSKGRNLSFENEVKPCHVMLPGAAGHLPVPLQEDLNCHSSHGTLGLHAGSVKPRVPRAHIMQ